MEDYIIDILNRSDSPPYIYYCVDGVLMKEHPEGISPNIYDLNHSESSTPFLPQFFSVKAANLLTLTIGRLFISGDVSSVGKSTICLGLIKWLIKQGFSPCDIVYIKPVTQCEEEQPVTRYCNKMVQ